MGDFQGHPFRGNQWTGTVYHGTAREFKEFDLNAPKVTGGGLNRYGVFVTPDQQVAARYAKDFATKGSRPRVLKLSLAANKMLELSAVEYDRLQDTVGKIDRNETLSEFRQMDREDFVERLGAKPGTHPMQAIREAGFDAVSRPAKGSSEAEILVLDPKRLTQVGSDYTPARDASRSTPARLSVRAGTYRDKPGFGIHGKDTKGRSVRIFTSTRESAERIKAKVARGEAVTSADFAWTPARNVGGRS